MGLQDLRSVNFSAPNVTWNTFLLKKEGACFACGESRHNCSDFKYEMEACNSIKLSFFCACVQGEAGPPGITGPVGPRGDPGELVRIVLCLLCEYGESTTCWDLFITVLLCLLSGPSRATRPKRSWWDTRSSRKHHAHTGNMTILLCCLRPYKLQWCCCSSYLVLLTLNWAQGVMGRHRNVTYISFGLIRSAPAPHLPFLNPDKKCILHTVLYLI